jgi:hypothetical protein
MEEEDAVVACAADLDAVESYAAADADAEDGNFAEGSAEGSFGRFPPAGCRQVYSVLVDNEQPCFLPSWLLQTDDKLLLASWRDGPSELL